MIGKTIKERRLMLGIKLNELARKAGINASYLSALERGEKKNPSIEILNKIAIALDSKLYIALR